MLDRKLTTPAQGPGIGHNHGPELIESDPTPPRRQKCAWRVRDWCEILSVSRAHAYREMAAGQVEFVMIGRARRITTAPQAYIRDKATGQIK
jgi:hypothetical protein